MKSPKNFKKGEARVKVGTVKSRNESKSTEGSSGGGEGLRQMERIGNTTAQPIH